MKTICTCQTINYYLSRNIKLACAAAVLAGALSACGGGKTSANPNPTPTTAAKTTVQVSMGDAPADWMLAFSMTINSMTLVGSNGSVNAVASPTTMEMMHVMGTMQPLAMISAPQGSYTSASIGIGSATVMYMDPKTKSPIQKTITGPITGKMNFDGPITVGSTPVAMDFDMDLASSITADASGNVTMKPVFHVRAGTQGSGDPLDPANGGIRQMMGSVSSISGNSFSMTSMQAAHTFNFNMNSSTEFDGITSMSMMANGMLVAVDASMQSDGSLTATRIRSMMNTGGVMGGGVITAVTGQPATQLTIVMQRGAGTGMMSSALAGGATITLNGSTVYEIDKDNIDMTNLPFTPVFDGGHVYAGQSAMPISSSGMMSGGSAGMMGGGPIAGTITASEVDLEQQGLSGTVASAITSGARTSFTLTLPTDSAFSTLTGATTVTVYQQLGTTTSTASSIAAGSTVHVLGLLFLDSGQWQMVTSRIGSN